MEPEPCAAPGVAADALRERVALELSTARDAPVIVALDDAPALVVNVREGCPETEVAVTLVARQLTVSRRVALGDGQGAAREWALALVIVDLLRSPLFTGPRPDERTTELDVESEVDAAVDAEVDVEPPPLPEAAPEPAPVAAPTPQPWESELTVAAIGRMYLTTPTPFGGVRLAARHAWLGVAFTALGTEAGASAGQIAAGLFLLDVSVRPVEHTDGAWTWAVELAVSGGVGHAAGRPARADANALSTWFPSLGGLVRGRARWVIDARFALDAGVAAGFDAIGPDLYLGVERPATTWGAMLEATLGGALPL